MKTLSIDIETFSSVDLAKCGVYKYTEAPDFDILLFGYSTDGGPVQEIDLACGEMIPPEVIAALTDDPSPSGPTTHSSRGYVYPAGSAITAVLTIPTTAFRRTRSATISIRPLGNARWSGLPTWALPLSLEGSGAVLGLDKAEADRRQRTHQVLLSALRCRQKQTAVVPATCRKTRSGQVGSLQTL
jgi:DNA polymerase